MSKHMKTLPSYSVEPLKLIEMLSHSIEVEERLCEQRITFFLSLAASSIAAVGLLNKIGTLDTDVLFWTLLGVLFSLLFYGLHTLNRMNWRYINMEIWRYQHDNAMQALSCSSPLMQRHAKIRETIKASSDKIFLNWINGSPAEFMYITNARIITGICVTWLWHAHWTWYHILEVCVPVFFIAIPVLSIPCRAIRTRAIPKESLATILKGT